MKRRVIPTLPPDALMSMPTKQLLGRLHSLQRCEEATVFSDRNAREIAAGDEILFKATAECRSRPSDRTENAS